MRPPEITAGELLKAAGMTLAVAESCTGGLLGGRLTGVAGSSAYFLGGVIAYNDSVKTALLNVPAALIAEHGAVSDASAGAMAIGVRSLTKADMGISITGVAGPGGGTPEKPVGATYVGVAGPEGVRVNYFLWQGDRSSNREASVQAALDMLVDYLRSMSEKQDKNIEDAE
ncbi:MAG: CinA family protein [Chloroflexi bacterium]|nr:CinA family protein [Chloroflexota bacterium]